MVAESWLRIDMENYGFGTHSLESSLESRIIAYNPNLNTWLMGSSLLPFIRIRDLGIMMDLQVFF